MNEILEQINASWNWTGLNASSVLQTNDFGNIIIKDIKSKIWRICPEDLSCIIIAENSIDFERLNKTEDFSTDWEMKTLVEIANRKLGVLTHDRKYCLKIPSILGGTYTADNLGTISFLELISSSGYLALEIKDLPDGSEIKLIID
ncbi:DUF1851 domain-containing protein [Leptospira noumeaensis]|uniref:DUF1851 domain-containing protein n=1 Tax=Leptospira noumeaensis TaxID=2484964 RepID=A0A4R9I926_9LEPT|nr:T6SS immunity protein Tdi1 domain-containing protein [Leptospira noumeaensis]TGK82975.1 DUF1851 domain-containing protein [Leptospira noumeaensis]